MPVFEHIVAEMEMCGMGKSDRDLLLGFLALTPPAYRADVLKDRRSYAAIGGEQNIRGVETWREAHEIRVKLEEADSSSKALVASVLVVGPPGLGSESAQQKRQRLKNQELGAAAVDRP